MDKITNPGVSEPVDQELIDLAESTLAKVTEKNG
jgi:hypothetical protein